MPRTVTLAVTLSDNSGATATVQLKVGNGRWSKTEPGGANAVFQVTDGPYDVKGGTAVELLRAGGGKRVGRFADLDPLNVGPKGSGTGLSDDAASAFVWKVTAISK